MARQTPLAAVVRGLASGVIGTAAMTAWQELSMKLQSSGDESGSDGDEGEGGGQESDPWEQASAPAQAGRKGLEGVFGISVPPDKIGLLTTVMHWGYGSGWGAAYGLVQRTSPGPALRRGVLFGMGVWAMSYVQLVPMGLYQPPWKYPPKELAMDLSYHLAYGSALGAAYAALDRSR